MRTYDGQHSCLRHLSSGSYFDPFGKILSIAVVRNSDGGSKGMAAPTHGESRTQTHTHTHTHSRLEPHALCSLCPTALSFLHGKRNIQ
eukprot:1357495-Amphidinium_carterae.3